MTKTPKTNTRNGERNAMQNAIAGGVKIPAYLSVDEAIIGYLNGIIRCRAFDTWNDCDLFKAVHMAHAQFDIARLQAEIRTEGDIVKSAYGSPMVNPKHNILETLSRRELALSRALQVHTSATMGRGRDSGAKAAKAQQAKLYAIDAAREKAKGLIPGLDRDDQN